MVLAEMKAIFYSTLGLFPRKLENGQGVSALPTYERFTS